jgi:hypothetical protein
MLGYQITESLRYIERREEMNTKQQDMGIARRWTHMNIAIRTSERKDLCIR